MNSLWEWAERSGTFGVVIVGLLLLFKYALIPLAKVYEAATANNVKAAEAAREGQVAQRAGAEAMARGLEIVNLLTERFEGMWNKLMEKVP